MNTIFHLRIVDGVVDAAHSEGGCEVGGVTAHHQEDKQPPGGRHHPAGHRPGKKYRLHKKSLKLLSIHLCRKINFYSSWNV